MMVEFTNTNIAAALTPALVANSLSPVPEPLLRATQSCGPIKKRHEKWGAGSEGSVLSRGRGEGGTGGG